MPGLLPGHPRLARLPSLKAWMAGTSPAMTTREPYSFMLPPATGGSTGSRWPRRRELAGEYRRDRCRDRHLDFFAWAISTSAAAVNTPSASLRGAGVPAQTPSPSAMPSEKLRDCGLEQVRMRSPSPERPGQGRRAARRTPRRSGELGKAARGQRGRGAGAEPAAGHDAGRDRQHVLGGAADLDAAHVGRMIGPERRPSRSLAPAPAASASSAAASVTAVGKPTPTSAAKARSRRIAGVARGAHSAMISVMNCMRAALDALGAGDHRGAVGHASAPTT